MSDNSTFRLTFHVFHPTVPASEIERAFRLPIRFSQSAGEQRKTKSGKELDGNYKVTNVSFELHEKPLKFNDVLIDDLIKKQLGSFDIDYITGIVNSGGSCNFLLGVFSNDNVMFELSNETISMLFSAKSSIKYDFYGGD